MSVYDDLVRIIQTDFVPVTCFPPASCLLFFLECRSVVFPLYFLPLTVGIDLFRGFILRPSANCIFSVGIYEMFLIEISSLVGIALEVKAGFCEPISS